VSVQRAFLIAAGVYQDEALSSLPHADADATALARALEALGFAREHQVLLSGAQATRTAAESKLRRLTAALGPGDALYAYCAGHAFTHADQTYLTCADSQADDLPATSLPLRSILDALAAAAAGGTTVLLLDAPGIGLPVGPELTPGPHEPEVRDFFTAANAVGLTSCRPGEGSHSSGRLKHGIWAYHLLEALTGDAPRALEGGRLLTASSLQAHLVTEVERTLRKTFQDARTQTPCLYAPAGRRFVIADLAPLLAGREGNADPRYQQLKRGSLHTETTAKVKSLSGFHRFHHVPERVTPWARQFVAEAAAEDVKADVDAVYSAIRERLGYKRRDVEAGVEPGCGFVRTPDFDYQVGVTLADEDPTTVIWRREVVHIRTPEVVLGEGFQSIFGGSFDTLLFQFAGPFDVRAWVDRVEDEAPEGVQLRCASDCSLCEISAAGFPGTIRLRPDRVEIQGRRSLRSADLAEALLRFQDLFAGAEMKGLPLKGPG
jgi:hypothetical protein